ncbi:MAG: aminoglycoside phosphotransferase family protein [Defluviitaleaceae bacterium]|nr:aminoglycoside phosphotransferase family protein [Defluviitaleaceae bacterium]
MDFKRIREHFGTAFLEKLRADLDKYRLLWGLSEIEQIDYYSVNCLFYCLSAEHGACVLKINPNAGGARSEYNMLKDFGGGGMCRVHEADLYGGALLIERISPGTQLRDETGFDIRLGVFCTLFRGLHKPPGGGVKYDTYMGWVSRIAAFLRQLKDHKELSAKMDKAEEICRELWDKYPRRLLLHGDLHHDNILLGESGYRAVDPKGVVGDPVFDIPRFMLNEDDLDKNDKFACLVQKLSAELGVDESDIRRLYYVEICMENSWSAEDGGEVSMSDVLFAERMLCS